MRKTAFVNMAMLTVVLLFLAFNYFAFKAADDSFSCYPSLQTAISPPHKTAMPTAQIGILPALLALETDDKVKYKRRKQRNFRDRSFGKWHV